MPSSKGDSASHKDKVAVGRRYEQRAAAFYEQRGFEILERNWRAGHQEIDLIVQKGSVIAFVEVKYSATLEYGHPAERVDKNKMAAVAKAAKRYLIGRNTAGCDLRFDVVTFLGDRLEHFPNAFSLPE